MLKFGVDTFIWAESFTKDNIPLIEKQTDSGGTCRRRVTLLE